MITVLCFKWAGYRAKDYDCGAVNRLRSMLARNLTVEHELVCCTDNAEGINAGIRIVPMPKEALELPERYPKLYAFHPDGARLFGKRVALLDLDIVIVGNIDSILTRTEPFVGLETDGWGNGSRFRFNTTFALFDGGAYPNIWSDFEYDRSREIVAAIRRTRNRGGTDQHWVSYCLNNEGAGYPHGGQEFETFHDLPDRAVLPDAARIISFGGAENPRLGECQRAAPWIMEHWR